MCIPQLLITSVCCSCNFLAFCCASTVTCVSPARVPSKEKDKTPALSHMNSPEHAELPWQLTVRLFDQVSRGSAVYALVPPIPCCAWGCRLISDQVDKAAELQSNFFSFFFTVFTKFISQINRSLERRRQGGKATRLAAAG